MNRSSRSNASASSKAAPGDFTQILFSISEMPELDAKAYLAAEDQMLASVKASAAKPPATP